jgi:hypothetical protein
MSDSNKPELPDLPEKIDLHADKAAEEVSVSHPMEDSGTRALADALSSSFKIIKVLMLGLFILFIGSVSSPLNPTK